MIPVSARQHPPASLGHLQASSKTGMSIPPIERFLARLSPGGYDWR